MNAEERRVLRELMPAELDFRSALETVRRLQQVLPSYGDSDPCPLRIDARGRAWYASAEEALAATAWRVFHTRCQGNASNAKWRLMTGPGQCWTCVEETSE